LLTAEKLMENVAAAGAAHAPAATDCIPAAMIIPIRNERIDRP